MSIITRSTPTHPQHSLSIPTDPIYQYVKICTSSLNPNSFSQILKKQVQFTNETNGVSDYSANALAEIQKIFEERIFNHSINHTTPTFTIEPKGIKQYLLHLNYEVEKTENNVRKRYKMEETTFFLVELDDPSLEFEYSKEPATYRINTIKRSVFMTQISVTGSGKRYSFPLREAN